MRHIAVLGSTGSIGTQTLDVARMHPDKIKVVGLACGKNAELIEKQAREFHPEYVAVYDDAAARDLKVRLKDTDIRVESGMNGLTGLAALPSSDTLVTGIVGMIGIRPTIAAIDAGKDIALANKETLVCAGHIIMPFSKEKKIKILPVDSEHSAIFQSLQGRGGSKIKKIILTASGGPFRKMTEEELSHVTVKEALSHPTWTMGPKVTIDSASMVNKGLEVIEARWLFDVDPDSIEVVVQPQSVLHSAVLFEDNSVIGQLGVSDMRIPIQYALTWPDHLPSPAAEIDFFKLGHLDFEKPPKALRGLSLARSAIKKGGSMPCAFNAANEWANKYFRNGRINFLQIYDIIEKAMSMHRVIPDPSVDEIENIEREITEKCESFYG